MENSYWLLTVKNPEDLENLLNQVRGFGNPLVSHEQLQISLLMDEGQEYATNAVVQALFTEEQLRFMETIGTKIGDYEGGYAEKEVTEYVKTYAEETPVLYVDNVALVSPDLEKFVKGEEDASSARILSSK